MEFPEQVEYYRSKVKDKVLVKGDGQRLIPLHSRTMSAKGTLYACYINPHHDPEDPYSCEEHYEYIPYFKHYVGKSEGWRFKEMTKEEKKKLDKFLLGE